MASLRLQAQQQQQQQQHQQQQQQLRQMSVSSVASGSNNVTTVDKTTLTSFRGRRTESTSGSGKTPSPMKSGLTNGSDAADGSDSDADDDDEKNNKGDEEDEDNRSESPPKPKRKRGRPPKVQKKDEKQGKDRWVSCFFVLDFKYLKLILIINDQFLFFLRVHLIQHLYNICWFLQIYQKSNFAVLMTLLYLFRFRPQTLMNLRSSPMPIKGVAMKSLPRKVGVSATTKTARNGARGPRRTPTTTRRKRRGRLRPWQTMKMNRPCVGR